MRHLHNTLHLIIIIPFFFFNDTATTEIYTLSLHDALPISHPRPEVRISELKPGYRTRDFSPKRSLSASRFRSRRLRTLGPRSEEHTSELQSPDHLVCRLLLEKKKIYAELLLTYR